MSEVASKFLDQNGLYTLEGRHGLESLALLCNNLGYSDFNHYGQFDRKTPNGRLGANLGDIFEFLSDNPAAIEAIVNWVDEQNIPEWNDTIEDEDEDEDEDTDEDEEIS